MAGVVSSAASLSRYAAGARPDCDLAEFRVDLFGVGAPGWREAADALRAAGVPVLLTARDVREGGRWTAGDDARASLYREMAGRVDAVDGELAGPGFSSLVSMAREHGLPLIGSHHDFNGLPADDVLRRLVRDGAAAGATIVKVAAVLADEVELARFERLLSEPAPVPLALVGMGPLGPRSRVQLARAGSCLTYGYVDEPTAPGQSSAAELMAALK